MATGSLRPKLALPENSSSQDYHSCGSIIPGCQLRYEYIIFLKCFVRYLTFRPKTQGVTRANGYLNTLALPGGGKIILFRDEICYSFNFMIKWSIFLTFLNIFYKCQISINIFLLHYFNRPRPPGPPHFFRIRNAPAVENVFAGATVFAT